MTLEATVTMALNGSNTVSDYSKTEESVNAITHALGVLMGLVGLVLLLLNTQHLSLLQTGGLITYGTSVIVLFLASTLYHSSTTPLWQKRFKMADHCAIYTLIAGTYTPLMLIAISSTTSHWILFAIWCLAIGGIVFKTLFIGRFETFSVLLYLAMGWLCVTVFSDLKMALSTLEMSLLIAGGIFYSVGVIFYVIKRIPYNHAIWHLFVLAGAFSHFGCIYFLISN
ncbi:hemolysin III family protein [Shewanella intestini]|uniref:Hemolysin III family protein n=1 Tax=Shewanella intestini TaxID=2017544 RepID=A0ABS5HZN1_9GAMM|nr:MULTISPECIES: hemolysin III family protein [Shewanella]MBR9727252.1 hemolysin III family protein [Shewanella intestini]MRG36054.1 hemolysin III family protein [Shewanella sp. XMDDZSB0408]